MTVPRNIGAAFARHEEGNVLILTGLALLLLFAVGGAAVDFGRQQLVRMRLQQASDAAALAAAAEPNAARREQTALRYFQVNYPDEYMGVPRPDPQISVAGAITVRAGDDVATNFISTMNISSLRADAYTRVAADVTSPQAYEMILALDNSGSMAYNEDIGSSPNYAEVPAALAAEARSEGIAACELLNRYSDNYYPAVGVKPCAMIPDSRPAVLSAADDILNYGFTRPNRLNALRYSAKNIARQILVDTTATGSRMGLIRWAAPVLETVGLNARYATIAHQLDSMTAYGNTNSALAMEAAETMAAGFTDGKVHAIVLLSDGENHDPHYRGARPSTTSVPDGQGARINADTLPICQRLKNRNVLIYTIAFGTEILSDSLAVNLMQNCASGVAGANINQYYFPAATAVELESAFQSIAGSIQRIRITD